MAQVKVLVKIPGVHCDILKQVIHPDFNRIKLKQAYKKEYAHIAFAIFIYNSPTHTNTLLS